jgi:hypothetical protein
MSQNLNGAIAFFGTDIGKNSFHVVGLDARCAIARARVARRTRSAAATRQLPTCWRLLRYAVNRNDVELRVLHTDLVGCHEVW